MSRQLVILFFVAFQFTSAYGVPQSEQRIRASSIEQWIDDLEKLDPARPMDYFILAEDIGDAADDDLRRELAGHLFALAGALDPSRLGRSAALALADLEQDNLAKRRLLALASLLDRYSAGSARMSEDHRLSNETLKTIAEIFSLYRTGRGPQALAKLERSEASDVLIQYSYLLPGGYNQFLQDCRIYKANLHPTLSDGELVRMLRLESGLLAADDRSWASDLLLNNGATLLEIDPQRIDETFRIDVTKNVYRNGQWTKLDGS